MKILNYLLLFLMLFGLTACPGPGDIFYTIDSFSAQPVESDSCKVLSKNDTIVWNEFAIWLNFKTAKDLSGLAFLKNNSNVVYAARSSGYIATSPIVGITIMDNINQLDLQNNFITYRYKELYEETIECLNIMSLVNFEEQWITVDNTISKNYLKLKDAPSATFTGKFYISLELEDGTILKDSTQTITILP